MTPKFALWLLLSLIGCASGLRAQQRYELTAAEAADFARKNSVQVKNALLDVQIQQQTNREITANAYPQVNANAGITYNPLILGQRVPDVFTQSAYGALVKEGVKDGQGRPIVMPEIGYLDFAFGAKWQNNAGVSLQQLLFDGQVFVGLQARRASMEFARKAVEVTEENIRANVYKIYYQLAASRYQLAIIDANIVRLQKFSSDTRKIYEAGFAEKLDIDKVNVQLTNLQTERTKVVNMVDNGYLGLKLLMGMPLRDTLVLKDTVSLEQVRQGVLEAGQYKYEDRKEYQYAQKGLELRRYNIKRYQYTYFPTVALASNYSLLRQSDKFGFGGSWSKGAAVGLNIQVPIFDGFAKAARIQRARLELQRSENDVEGLRLSIDQQVLTAQNNFASALSTLDNQKRNMELADKVYNQTRKKYEIGSGSQTEITAADADLRTAQSNYYNALYDAINARIELMRATGKLQ
ncbi:TolC family protein [Flaviaesturariibacter aridisoli]|uniref:TolC family protein n=1 Tax=Flaviaesturariibacter aridisoli TaxID=2545761 RepID=A0A4R4E1N2_9BACT|nr:TolC family protein [Flaviaesturariibacter aridisoli]TCZ68837.1 TolC family protein [Flaviaesturariibacter aridisoli]